MKRFSIKYQILLIAMVPVFLVDVLLISIHIDNSIQQAEKLLQSKGQIIAKQLAEANEFNLFSGNYDQIQYLLDQSINTNDIIYAAVYDIQGKVVARALGKEYSPENTLNYFYYRQPIQTQNIGVEDIFEPELNINDSLVDSLGWVHLNLSKHQLEQNKNQIFIESAILFCGVLILGVFLTLIISRRITNPIFKLLSHLNRVETGHLGEVIQEIENNEIGDVQKGFNSMSQSLLANRMQLDQKIEKATLELKKAISELEYKNRELGIARDIAQNADRVKSQFLANMSHEIRTPINGIQGFANLLAQSKLNSDQMRYADIISQSTKDLTLIVNEILDYSKIESGKIDIAEQSFDLFELLETTRDSLFTTALEKHIDLHLIIYSDTPRFVIGDDLRLKQIMINLVGNAIKFTDQGHVSITVYVEDVTEDQCLIRFNIEDSGIGISEQDQQLLFQAFKQLESDANRRFSGTGLGLVISKNLALLMGGEIQVNSELHSGSLFSLLLPFSHDASVQTDALKVLEPEQTAMVIAFNQLCINEDQSLLRRIGFNTEHLLIKDQTETDQLSQQISQNLNFLDLIVIDLRHCQIHPDTFIDRKIRQRCRVMLLHYDSSLIDQSLYSHYQFVSVINTCSKLRQMLLEEKSLKPDTKQVDDESTTLHCPNKILLVDDNPINLKLASELTRLWGHEAYEASNAQQAMSLFNSETFDLILLDIQMPETDGIELMRMMRQQNPDLLSPIVAITANIQDSERERLLGMGFDAFISKPIDEDKFHALLDQQTFIFEDPSIDPNVINKDVAIDYELTLKLSANSESLAADMLKLLQQEIPQYQERLGDILNSNNLEQLEPIMHKIQGVTCYTGLPRLKHLLSVYEQEKQQASPALEAICQEIIDELERINKVLKQDMAESES